MTLLEDRLTTALDARAHQIDESDLGPAVLPGAASHRRNGVIILAAAACTALVIGVPYAIAQLDTTPDPPRPPASAPPPAPTSTTAPGIGVGADWPVVAEEKVDLDGDGSDEAARLRLDPEVSLNPSGFTRARVEVDLPTGVVYTVLTEGTEYHLEGAVTIPGSAGQELLVSVGTALKVFDLVDGNLTRLKDPEDPPLVRRTDNEGRMVTWLAVSQGLYSLRSLDTFDPDRAKYAVERWRWRISGDSLVAEEDGSGCVRSGSPTTMVECQPRFPSQLAPEPFDSVGLDTEVNPHFAVDGQPATARLVMDPRRDGDFFREGEIKLVVTAGGRSWEADLPAGDTPVLYTEGVILSSTEGGLANLVVGRLGILGTYWEVFSIVDDELVQLAVPSNGPTLATTYDDPTVEDPPTKSFSWMQGLWLYSWYGDGTRKQAYRWEQTGRTLNPVLIGTYCTDADELYSC